MRHSTQTFDRKGQFCLSSCHACNRSHIDDLKASSATCQLATPTVLHRVYLHSMFTHWLHTAVSNWKVFTQRSTLQLKGTVRLMIDNIVCLLIHRIQCISISSCWSCFELLSRYKDRISSSALLQSSKMHLHDTIYQKLYKFIANSHKHESGCNRKAKQQNTKFLNKQCGVYRLVWVANRRNVGGNTLCWFALHYRIDILLQYT